MQLHGDCTGEAEYSLSQKENFRKQINGSMQHIFLSGMKKKDKICKLCLMPLRKRQECRRPEGECGKFSYKKEKVALKESMQNVSRSGERGGMTTRACRHWL